MAVTSKLITLVLLFVIPIAYAQHTLPLKISSDKRYLVDQKNKPFPILGRTAWFILSQPESGYKHFIENTLTHGHNAIEFAAIMHWPTGNHAPFNGEGEMPFLRCLDATTWNGVLKYDSGKTKQEPDLLTPNEKYWSYLDRFLAYCESKGLVVFMFPAYIGYAGQEQGWMRELVANGPAKTEAYGAWVANRYKSRKNIVWMLLGDYGNLKPKEVEAEAALVKGLKSVKGQQSLQYTAESHSGENAADNKYFGKEMTINGVYTWELKVPVPYLGRTGYSHARTMPAFLLEEPYDEEGPDGNNYNPNAVQPVRRFQWWGWLTTIGGYISGNGYVWQFVDPFWQQHLETQGAQDMARLNTFIKSVEWWKLIPSGLAKMKNLIPDPTNIDTTASFISASAAADGSLFVAYIPPAFPPEKEINVDLSVLKGNLSAYWFDPTTGTYTRIDKKTFKIGSMSTFNLPGKNIRGENDWVLLISHTSPLGEGPGVR